MIAYIPDVVIDKTLVAYAIYGASGIFCYPVYTVVLSIRILFSSSMNNTIQFLKKVIYFSWFQLSWEANVLIKISHHASCSVSYRKIARHLAAHEVPLFEKNSRPQIKVLSLRVSYVCS
jgi:hypothetical protein